MKHKVRLTVIDKNCIRSCSNSTALIRIPAHVPAIMWVMYLNSTEMMSEMISGTVA